MAHVKLYIHRILEFLKTQKHKVSFKEVELKCGVKISAVIQSLRSNPKVRIEGDKISYITEFCIKTRKELKDLLINENEDFLKKEKKSIYEGIELARLDDGPYNVSKLLFSEEEINRKSLTKDNNKVVRRRSTNKEKAEAEKDNEDNKNILKNIKSKDEIYKFIDNEFIVIKDLDGSEIVFYYDSSFTLPIGNEIKTLYSSIKVPEHQDLLEELNKGGFMNTSIHSNNKLLGENNKAMKKELKKKNKKRRRNIKITNTHVKDLNLEGMDDSD